MRICKQKGFVLSSGQQGCQQNAFSSLGGDTEAFCASSADEEGFDRFSSVWHRLEDCLTGSFLKAWVAEVLVGGFEEVFHRMGATEDSPVVDGEVVVSPWIGGSLVEERERRVDLARGLDVVDVLNEVAMEGLVAFLASVVPVWRVDLIADARVGLRSGLLSRGLASGRWYRGRSGIGLDSLGIEAGDACYSW